MKNLIKILTTFFVLTFASAAWADITTGKFSTAQIFDVQWSISGGTLNTSGYNYLYRSVPSATRMTSTNYANIDAAGQYFAFFDSTTNPGTYGMALYNSDGTLAEVIHNTGTFRALADGAIFYNGAGSWGTLITTAQGYSIGGSATFTVEIDNPTDQQMSTWVPDSTEPLASGETAAPAAPPAPTPVYRSAITTVQQAQVDAAYGVTTGNNIDLTITGDSNDVDITQLSNGNYLLMYLQGNSNVTDITQSGTNADRNFADINIVGSSNTLNFTQQGDSEKQAMLDIDGSFGTYTITQQGSGEHYLDLTSVGDNATVTVLQEGLGNHAATVELTNSGGNWNFSLTQSGDTNQLYSLPHDLSDNTVVSGSCTTGTCNLTINQQ
jgi:hypothetical protein